MPKQVLLVPRTEHHLSSLKYGFLNISRANICCILCHAYCFYYTVEQIWHKKCLKSHIPFNFLDDSTLANQGAGKTIEKPLEELPSNQQVLSRRVLRATNYVQRFFVGKSFVSDEGNVSNENPV